MSLYDDNDRAMARCEADWLRDPREDDDGPDPEAEAREALRVVLGGVALAAHGTHDGAVEAGARAIEATEQRLPWEADWTEADAVDAPQAEALGARRAA